MPDDCVVFIYHQSIPIRWRLFNGIDSAYGTNNGQLNYPECVAVDSSNNVYVVDANNSRVEKFDGNGNYLGQWGSFGTNNGQFYFPGGIAVDSSNNVYVTAFYNDRVEKFDSNGN